MLLAVLACGQDKKTADQPPPPPGGADSFGDYGPCGSGGDTECEDSLEQSQQMRAFAAAPKQMKALSFAAVVQSYKPDSSKYRVRYSVSRALNQGETLYVRLRRDTTGANTLINTLRKKITQRDSVDFVVDKVFGKAAAYSAILQYKRNMGAATTLQTSRWTTNFPTPIDTTPPGVDSLIVDSAMALLLKPEAPKIDRADWEAKGIFFQDSLGNLYDKNSVKLPFKCPAGGTRCPGIQFCTFVVFGDSAIAMRAEDKDKPECQFEYSKFPATRTTNIRVKQQQKADAMCIKYSVDPKGGTITSAVCGVPS
jgi:hypothetical protein